jgi:cytochrome c553
MAIAVPALAQSPDAGPAIAATVCAACHGANGVSVADTIPNLAGQRAKYLEAQLRFFKDGTRKEPGGIARAAIMNAVAAQLGTQEIAELAAYFSAQPPAAGKSPFLPNLAETRMPFPEAYRSRFTRYAQIDFPERKQRRVYYANSIALSAARAGEPLPDGSILLVEVFSGEKLSAYTAMARGPGWGERFPQMLRNEDWNYAIFGPDRRLRDDVNQAECLACHKPRAPQSYTFTLRQLTETARR